MYEVSHVMEEICMIEQDELRHMYDVYWKHITKVHSIITYGPYFLLWLHALLAYDCSNQDLLQVALEYLMSSLG